MKGVSMTVQAQPLPRTAGRPSRRAFLATPSLATPLGCVLPRSRTGGEPPYTAMGERVGEVGPNSAIVHIRLTRAPTRNDRGYTPPYCTHSLNYEQRHAVRLPEGMRVEDLEGACPGQAGWVRVRYGGDAALADAAITPWAEATAESDFTHQFVLNGLAPDTRYHYAVETRLREKGPARTGPVGRFRTAPDAQVRSSVRFFVITGQDYACRDHLRGYRAYAAMKRLGADFLVSTGDSVYYDIDLPLARSVELARYHWHRIYSQALVVELFRTMSGYWLKDDHDSFEDDDWPGRPPERVAPMTYQDLAPIFREQVPMGERTYRRARWGKGLELWFVEVRDFRSPNPAPDGPEKTIWGAQQKAWLKRTLLESDADFRVLVSPTCIVGPDRPGREVFTPPQGGADSHGDGGFAYEGREFRHWVRDQGLKNLVIVNGDRHWQYHSVDPETGLHEFGCGALTDHHSNPSPPRSQVQRFVRGRGGFLSVAYDGAGRRPRLVMRFHDVDGREVYEFAYEVSA